VPEARRLEGRLAAVTRGAGIRDRRRIRLVPDPEPEQLPLALDGPIGGLAAAR
jgi:hypothetical protein